MPMQKIQGNCPNCGKTLEIPADLTHFSCMYCGAKLALDELVVELPQGDFDEAMAYVRAHILDSVRDYDLCQKQFTRKAYDDTFHTYQSKIAETFAQLDLACRLRPATRDQVLDQAVTEFLDRLPEVWEADKRWKRKSSHETVMFDVKFAIALYLTPAVLNLELTISEDFVQLLHQKWIARYPNSPYETASYAKISSGFRHHRLCFITTAICRDEGKPDNCAELTAFRAFRDGYLAACEDGPALIDEYYNIAPAIVTCIDLCDDSAAAYRSLRQTYLLPCYDDLQHGRYQSCKERYIVMVRVLREKYLAHSCA